VSEGPRTLLPCTGLMVELPHTLPDSRHCIAEKIAENP
jgi:hypothetical protein